MPIPGKSKASADICDVIIQSGPATHNKNVWTNFGSSATLGAMVIPRLRATIQMEGWLMTTGNTGGGDTEFNLDWSRGVHEVFGRSNIRHAAYVPDAGLAPLINLCRADDHITASILTTEQEGVGLLTGAWLGGERGVLMMQSSGVGNCINTLSMTASCKTPLLLLVTMRGEWVEFNPWQVPIGQAAQTCLEAIGVIVYRVDEETEVPEVVEAAIDFAFNSRVAVAVLLSQRMIGRKHWGRASDVG